LVLRGDGRFDPPTTPLDADGQSIPDVSYASTAQAALVEVDIELGIVHCLHIVAAHDVRRAINPQRLEGHIRGGIAQGLALMEEFTPARTENLHDYLISSIGDIPAADDNPDRTSRPAGSVRRRAARRPRGRGTRNHRRIWQSC
jgi:aldehyde oxidoreductase